MRRGLGNVTLKNIMVVNGRDGKPRRYYRTKVDGKAKLVPLPALPMDSPDFLAAYAEAARAFGKTVQPQGSIAKLCADFLKSRAFFALSLGYQVKIESHVRAIAETGKTAMVRHLQPKHVKADMAPLLPSAAQSRLKAWRLLVKFGGDLFATDPTIGIKKPKLAKSEGHVPWTDTEVDMFRARWPIGTVRRAIFELLHWTGARISDAVMIGPGMVDRDGVLTFRQFKTKDEAYVPWTGQLPLYAAHLAADRAMMHEALKACRGHMTFLATSRGKTRSHKAIGNDLSSAARIAGVDKTAHGLRKTRAVKLIEGGATTHDAMAWTGHQTVTELEHYAKSYSRKKAVVA